MDAYKAQVFLHVAVVIVALGATFAYPFLQGWAERQGVGATRMMLEFSHFLEKYLVIPGAIVIFVLGLGLIFDDNSGYKDDFPAWLAVGIAWFLVALTVGAFVQRANVLKGIDVLQGVPDGPELPAAYTAVSRRISITGAFLGLSVLGITFLMVWKPGE